MLEAGKKYKLRRLKDLYCNYTYIEEKRESNSDYLFDGREGMLNPDMDLLMGKEVTIDSFRWSGIRYDIVESTSCIFYYKLFEVYKEGD